MHMDVDGAGKDMQAGRVEGFARRRHRLVSADGEHAPVFDGDTAGDHAVVRHQSAVADDEIGGHWRPWHTVHSIAQPPSTGRSMPVIWRDTSLERNRQALATSASTVTRLSA